MPVTDLTEKHVTILAALARYHGSYLPIDLLMREVYKDEIANAKSKGYVYTPPAAKIIDVFCCRLKDIFARNGFGEIERLWGVGRHIKPEAFMVLDAVKFDGNAPKEYAFSYDAALGVVNHPMIDNPIHLTPSENHLFSALMSSPGQVMKREMLLDTHDTKGVDVAMVKLREKLGGLYPDIEGFGHILIHTLHGRGYRLRPPAELEYLMDKARAEPPARRLRTSYPAANRDSSGFLGALKT
ncbi:MAG: hypothetical protein EBQ96_03120 [Proteobacteria bacterium]|nr:hypothetical protein [Pseudomonadota bacterium]